MQVYFKISQVVRYIHISIFIRKPDLQKKRTSSVEITSLTLQGPLANYKVGHYAAPSLLNWQLNLLRSIIIPLLSSVTLANDSGELEGFFGWVLMSLLFFKRKKTTECHQFKSCQCTLFQVAKTPWRGEKYLIDQQRQQLEVSMSQLTVFSMAGIRLEFRKN